MAIAYGASTMNSISRFAELLMSEVRAKDAGEVGQQITDLLQKVKGIDPGVLGQSKSWLESVPLLGRLFNRMERTLLEYQMLTAAQPPFAVFWQNVAMLKRCLNFPLPYRPN